MSATLDVKASELKTPELRVVIFAWSDETVSTERISTCDEVASMTLVLSALRMNELVASMSTAAFWNVMKFFV